MKVFASPFLLALLLHSSAFAQAKPMSPADLAAYSKPDREKILVEGAKKEGKVLWYTSLTGGPNQEVPKAFEAKYPGVKVEVYRASSEDLLARILQEAQAKRYLVDSVETTFPALKVMLDYKLLAPYFSPYSARYPDEVKEKATQGLVYWTTDRESYIGMAYNTDAISAAAAPKSFDDLLKPELKGKIGFATTDTGSRVIGAMLAVKGAEFIQKLKPQNVALHAVSGRAILDMVISGELGASPTAFLSHSRVSISKGAPIKWVPMDVVPTNAGGVALPANAPHPHGALLFADYLLSPEGQKLLGKFGLDSAVNKPEFKRWYPEKGMNVEQYEKENGKWDKLLREIGRK
ncbi:MAG TPA: extracellular solute-binding protein [Candidatus Binatia bacterium]|nr:extracellular solute-binding protein [Candidatus Binatia bacterium]